MALAAIKKCPLPISTFSTGQIPGLETRLAAGVSA